MTPRFASALLLGLASANAFAHGGGEAEIEIGAGKGVLEVTKDKSFKLSPEATKHFGLKTVRLSATDPSAPPGALVRTLKETQVFRLRDGYLKAVRIPSPDPRGKPLPLRSPELRPGDEIVAEGVGFLRIIAAQLGEAEAAGDGHGHDQERGQEHDPAHGAEGADHHD